MQDILPIYFICFPETLILFPVCPDIVAIALYLIALKLSFICATVLHTQYSVPLLHPINKTSLVFCSVDPLLMAIAVLDTVGPFPGKGSTILFKVYTLALASTFYPLSFIHLSISENFSTVTLGLIIFPTALEDGAVFI